MVKNFKLKTKVRQSLFNQNIKLICTHLIFMQNFLTNHNISYSWPYNFLPLPWPYRGIKFFIPYISLLKEATPRGIELLEIENSRKRIPWSVIPQGKLKNISFLRESFFLEKGFSNSFFTRILTSITTLKTMKKLKVSTFY